MNAEKVKAQLAEHWDMPAKDFDSYVVTETFEQNEGWEEVVFDNGTIQFFIEVNAKSEVWNFQYI